MNKFSLLLCLYLILPTINQTSAQIDSISFPIDTSYTIYSAYQKLIKDYPYIKIIKAEFDNIKMIENIVYAKREKRELHLDLFKPSDEENAFFPVVILIHGGGWRSGNKSMMHPLAAKLVKNNYVAITVEYRLSPEAKYPAAIYDLKSAVRWIKKNGNKYNIDTSKITAVGCSAGGTLAAFLGVTNYNAKFENMDDSLNIHSNINGIVDIDGILDFTDPAESGKDSIPGKPSAGKFWFGYSYKENPDIWVEASPLIYVNKNTPPIIFINSTINRFHAGRDEAIIKLKERNIYHEVHTIENSPHTFWLFEPWFKETSNLIINFLEKVFRDSNE